MADFVKIANQFSNFRKNDFGPQKILQRGDLASHEFDDADEKRIKYYLGELYDTPLTLKKSEIGIGPAVRQNKPILINYETLMSAMLFDRINKGYAFTLVNTLSLLPAEYETQFFLTQLTDYARKSCIKGLITQARLITDHNPVLQRFHPIRLWGETRKVRDLDVPYNRKKDSVVWRGATTNGPNKPLPYRYNLVSRHFENNTFLDIGFNRIVQGKEAYSYLLKPSLTMAEQLQHKFLVSVEGNDFASGLPWMLNSNSVVMMAKPTAASWAMEDHLIPFVHYLPLEDDYSNLEEQYHWALDNEDLCIEISENASKFIEPFLDTRKEILIECEVMRRYLDNIRFVD